MADTKTTNGMFNLMDGSEPSAGELITEQNLNWQTAENQIKANATNISLLNELNSLYSGTLAAGESFNAEMDLTKYRLILLIFSDASGSSALLGQALFSPRSTLGYIPVMYGPSATYARIQLSGNTLNFLASGNANMRLKFVFGLLK